MTRHSIHPLRAARPFGLLLIGILLAGATGCSAAPAKDDTSSLALQSQVLAVTKAAAASDPGDTLKLLDELAAKLDSSAMDGDITFQRHQSIMTAIEALRTELTAHLPAAPMTATAAAAGVPAPAVDQPDAGPGVVAPAPLRVWAAPVAPPLIQVPVAPAPAVQPPAVQPPAPTHADNGKGKNKGNGRG